jgi:hypothetical protein
MCTGTSGRSLRGRFRRQARDDGAHLAGQLARVACDRGDVVAGGDDPGDGFFMRHLALGQPDTVHQAIGIAF